MSEWAQKWMREHIMIQKTWQQYVCRALAQQQGVACMHEIGARGVCGGGGRALAQQQGVACVHEIGARGVCVGGGWPVGLKQGQEEYMCCVVVP
jgi:hypothetical protein